MFQEFWTKLLTHKLAGADQQQGAVPRLPPDRPPPPDHRPFPGPEDSSPSPRGPPGHASSPDEDYDRVWREAVLKRVLSRLETYEVTTAKNRYATVLQLRREHPKASIDEIARSSSRADRASPVTPEAFRKTLQRARAKFLELLIQELRETIHPDEPEDIEAEIFDLGPGLPLPPLLGARTVEPSSERSPNRRSRSELAASRFRRSPIPRRSAIFEKFRRVL